MPIQRYDAGPEYRIQWRVTGVFGLTGGPWAYSFTGAIYQWARVNLGLPINERRRR